MKQLFYHPLQFPSGAKERKDQQKELSVIFNLQIYQKFGQKFYNDYLYKL